MYDVVWRDISEDERRIGVNLLEGTGSALVHDTLRLETVILIEVVLSHALSKRGKFRVAEVFKDFLSGGTIIFSWEAVNGQ